MKPDKKIESFLERLQEVFSDELSGIGWQLKAAEKFEDLGKNVRQTLYYFTDKDEKRTLTMNVDQTVKVPAFDLQSGGNRKVPVFGLKDVSAIRANNKTALAALDEHEKALFDRIARYIELKIEEFIY